MRIAKFISNNGICSRRDAEQLIANGKVKLNGVLVVSPITFVKKCDSVEVDGNIVSNLSSKMWIYYKPVEVITSHNDYRKTVFKEVKNFISEHVISIGRLDYMSEGLLLLTNNPKIAHFFEKPQHEIERKYLIITDSEIPSNMQEMIRNGIIINGMQYKNIYMKKINLLDKSYFKYKKFFDNFYDEQIKNRIYKNSYQIIEMTLLEGKNREIRKIFSYFWMKVVKLIRFSYGDFSIDSITNGKVQPIVDAKVNQICKHIDHIQQFN